MYDEYDEGEGGSSLVRKFAMGIGVVAIIAAAFFAYRAVSGGDDQQSGVGGSSTLGGRAIASRDSVDETTVPDEAAATTDAPATTEAVTTTTSPATTSTEAATTTTAAPSTTAAPTTTAAAPTTTAAATYSTLPDGQPEWVVAIFDTNSITIRGEVPDQAAKDRLEVLARANAKPGQADEVVNEVTINPAVPRNVGVRVVELTSVRFPSGSAEITPEHAAELDRAVAIMEALPHISTLVIGHADQRGNEMANFAISDARARAVLTYMASRGIDPGRLQSRAVGENDLLTLDDSEAALALNRRTEFVFYGLLVE